MVRRIVRKVVLEYVPAKGQVVDKFAALITAAFGLVAALAWNDAVKEIFRTLFEDHANIPAQLMYAGLVTAVAVIATLWIGKTAEKVKAI